MDSATGESVLEVASAEEGIVLFSFHLYDAAGQVAAESDGFQHFPDGVTINCNGGEQLLRVPRDLTEPLCYRLYNSSGLLLTCSDGVRTKINSHLRMEGVTRGWTLPES